MKQLKAVVLEKKGSMVTVLASDGSFKKIRYRNPVEVGAEIKIIEPQHRQPVWLIKASVAAIFLFTFIGSMGWNLYQGTTAVAMISVDINPRLQLTIDQKGRVLQFEALNSDAERVVTGLELKGEPWNQALENIIGQSVALNYLNLDHDWVVVGYSPVKAGKENLEGVTPEDISQKIEGAAQAEGLDPKVAVYQLSAEEQSKAEEQGLTLGEFALMNTAKNAGVHAEANTVKGTKERVDLLEQPQVQKQLVKENRMKEVFEHTGTLEQGNDPEVSTPDTQSNSQPGNSVTKPSSFSRGDSEQEYKEQGKSEHQGTEGIQ